MRAVRLGTRGMVSSAKGASKAKAGKKEAETVAPKGCDLALPFCIGM